MDGRKEGRKEGLDIEDEGRVGREEKQRQERWSAIGSFLRGRKAALKREHVDPRALG